MLLTQASRGAPGQPIRSPAATGAHHGLPSLSLSLSLHGCLSLCLFDRVSFVCVSSTEYSILPSHLHCHYSSISVSTSIRIIVLVIASTLRLLNSGEGTKKNPQKQPAALSLSLSVSLFPLHSLPLPLFHSLSEPHTTAKNQE